MTKGNESFANAILAEIGRLASRSPQERIALGNALSIVLLNSNPPSKLRVFSSNLLKIAGLKRRDICDVCRDARCKGEHHEST